MSDAVDEEQGGHAAVVGGLLARKSAAESLPVGGRGGLGGQHGFHACGVQPLAEQAHLGGFSRSVHAVKDDEQGGIRMYGFSRHESLRKIVISHIISYFPSIVNAFLKDKRDLWTFYKKKENHLHLQKICGIITWIMSVRFIVINIADVTKGMKL
jgi:hypothetical protein